MPLPKRRHSRARGRKRRTNWTLTAPTLTTCSHCHRKKPTHQVCPHCGYYRGVKVREVEE